MRYDVFLFPGKSHQFGMDLVALNIQRGRDHGLPGYNAYREVCGLGRVDSFAALQDLVPAKLVARLQLIYAHVDDIDLFVGGISEAAETESLLGERCCCAVGRLQLTLLVLLPQVRRSGVSWLISLHGSRLATGL